MDSLCKFCYPFPVNNGQISHLTTFIYYFSIKLTAYYFYCLHCILSLLIFFKFWKQSLIVSTYVSSDLWLPMRLIFFVTAHIVSWWVGLVFVPHLKNSPLFSTTYFLYVQWSSFLLPSSLPSQPQREVSACLILDVTIDFIRVFVGTCPNILVSD